MTETPALNAAAPNRLGALATPDVLSDLLRAVRLTGAVFLNARFTAPFRIVSPKRFDPGMPMAHLRHISIFHLITAGGCDVELASGQSQKIGVGDLVLLPFADRHKFSNGAAQDTEFVPKFVRQGAVDGLWAVDFGGGGPETRMVCGFIESSEILFAPLFRSLPEILVEKTSEQRIGGLIASTVGEIISLTEAATPGSQTMLGRLMELLFLETLRRHVERLPIDGTNWLGALNDPIVGRALQLVHMDPVRKWTAGDLAREAGTSRTVLADRFNTLLGRPPIDYVTSWRIQLAADRLRNGREAIPAIAASVGYESEAAFGRAFKRVTGISPGRWRDGAGDSPPLMPLQLHRPLVESAGEG